MVNAIVPRSVHSGCAPNWHLQIDPTEMTALEAVLAVDQVKESLEREAEHLSSIVADVEVGSWLRLWLCAVDS